jgi:prepilin-type N-terminal cleavage/methylation domain-containing protein
MRNIRGFSAVEVIVVIVIVALLGAGAYLYMTAAKNAPADNQQPANASPITYSSNEDLDQATQTIDNSDIDADLDASLKELDAEAAAF